MHWDALGCTGMHWAQKKRGKSWNQKDGGVEPINILVFHGVEKKQM
jgi:hypothetical protein